MTTCLTIDVGQTGIRVRRADGRAQDIPWASVHLSIPGAARALASALLEIILGHEELACGGSPLRLAMSVTGFTRQGGREVLERLESALLLERAVIVSDLVATHLSVHEQHSGVTVIAGTGLTALESSPNRVHVLGGSGWLLGDIGGGFWIGSSGLREALRFEDGMGGSSRLHAAALERSGPRRTALAGMYAHPSPVKAAAEFAPIVAACAHAGDVTSRRIWREAVDEASRMIQTALRGWDGLAPPAVVVTGGLVREAELFLEPLREATEGLAEIRFVPGDALARCSRILDLDGSSRFADFIVTNGAAA